MLKNLQSCHLFRRRFARLLLLLTAVLVSPVPTVAQDPDALREARELLNALVVADVTTILHYVHYVSPEHTAQNADTAGLSALIAAAAEDALRDIRVQAFGDVAEQAIRSTQPDTMALMDIRFWTIGDTPIVYHGRVRCQTLDDREFAMDEVLGQSSNRTLQSTLESVAVSFVQACALAYYRGRSRKE